MSPVSHGVCNVVKRIAIIFSSVIFFKQVRCCALTRCCVGGCGAAAPGCVQLLSELVPRPLRVWTCSPLRAQVMTQQALIGTCIAIFGTWLYTDQVSRAKHASKPKAA